MPDGITDIRDCPWHLFDAISMALQFLSWQENLEEHEIPSKAIWFSPRALEDWFKAVKKRRDEKYGGDKDSSGEIEDPVQNAAAKGLIVGN